MSLGNHDVVAFWQTENRDAVAIFHRVSADNFGLLLAGDAIRREARGTLYFRRVSRGRALAMATRIVHEQRRAGVPLKRVLGIGPDGED